MSRFSKRVVIVVPMSNRNEFLADELISLRHLVKYLGPYDKYLVVPESSTLSYEGLGVKRFDNKYFGSVVRHTRLLFNTAFVESFSDYEYILIYHPDAIVLSDQLMAWCDRGFDYIGAPVLYEGDDPKKNGLDPSYRYLLNGGFSLRKTETYLRIVSEFRKHYTVPSYFDVDLPARNQALTFMKRNFGEQLKRIKIPTINYGVWEYLSGHFIDDHFFTWTAEKYVDDYKLPDLSDALGFAFETDPGYCYRLTNSKLPFGVHAWGKYDREFWKPYLLE